MNTPPERPAPAVLIRPSTAGDLPAITAVYAWNVDHGTGTFETEAPDLAEMTRRVFTNVAKPEKLTVCFHKPSAKKRFILRGEVG